MAVSKNSRTGRQAVDEDHGCLKKNNYGSGAGMYSKRDKKRTVGSHTVGGTKGTACQASAMDRHMAKASRSYKHRDYNSWLEKTWKVGYQGMSYEEYKEMINESDNN